MTEFTDNYRLASTILVDQDNNVLGQLPAIRLSTPWFQEVSELVECVESQFQIQITILRLLEVDDSRIPEIVVSYLAEVDSSTIKSVNILPWNGSLREHPLRLPYAKTGGPNRDLTWADSALKQEGYGLIIKQKQIRTWNLSSIWRLNTVSDTFWLKSVPSFFSHESRVLDVFKTERVPRVIAADPHRILMENLPGEDCYDAGVEQMLFMIGALVDLQWRWHNRLPELAAAGVPDNSSAFLVTHIPGVIDQYLTELSEPHQVILKKFESDLPSHLSQLDDCGIPSTLVHGDYHPGNWRGTGADLTILDWGDCCIGHPLLDQPALLDRAGIHAPALKNHWQTLWEKRLPDADVRRATRLIAPIASIRMALVYQHFLENIEPSERIYHDGDPVSFLQRTADILTDTQSVAFDSVE